MVFQLCRHALGRRPSLSRRFGAALLAAILAFHPVLAQARAAPRQAVLVVDANTGRVLYQKSADKPRFPASLTKLMTLYLVFEGIEQGRLSPTSKVRFSANAVAAPPSKLGAKEGTEIDLIDAVKALIVKSANDVAVAVAEHIAGSEEQFAQLMTRKARELGMKATEFRNASGLPDRDQVTTAQDMMTLALSLQDRFPKHYPLFASRTFTWGDKTYRNHNRLLFRYQGMDGMKTGYIRASGFNLVASARRGKKHVMVAYFGGRTSGRRNKAVRRRLDAGFAKASTRKTRRPAAPVEAEAQSQSHAKSQAKPQVKSQASSHAKSPPTGAQAEPKPIVVAAAAPPPQRVQQASAPVEVVRVRPVRLSAPASEVSPVSADAAAGLETAMASLAAAPAGAFQVQVGAYRTAGEAKRQLASVRERAGTVLGAHAAHTMQVKHDGKVLFRARYVGFEAHAAAAGVCSQLKRLDIDCLVMKAD